MKKNLKFLTSVASMLLTSAVLLVCGLYAIGSDNGEPKPYDNSDSLSDLSDLQFANIVQETPAEGDTPALTPQKDLHQIFNDMYEVSEDGKTITVISKEYLDKFWQSNYEKEEIHSLTTEEVYFVIHESIRIYSNYDKVILPEFASLSSDKQVAERFPNLKGKVIKTKPMKEGYYHNEDIEAIAEIIMYHLTALSSPKSFFTGAEAIRFVGGDPNKLSNLYPLTIFYIPNYSASVDRDLILKVKGGDNNPFDAQKFPDLIEITSLRSPMISIKLSSRINDSTKQVYPTAEMDQKYSSFYVSSNGNFFEISKSGGDSLTINKDISKAIFGSFLKSDDKLIFLAHDKATETDHQYIFRYHEGKGYSYIKDESTPIQGYELEDGMMFYFDVSKPTVTSIYISGDSNDWGTNIALNEGTGRLYLYTSKFSSYPLCGAYTESNGVLTYYPDNASGKSYSYVFLYEDGAWVYSREKSNPVGYNFDIKDGLRFKLLEKNSCTKKPVASIKDYAKINEIDTADELEQFYEDEKYVYSFPSIKSEYIIVTFTDGTEMNVNEALFKGYIDISDLDKYSINYYKEQKK